MFRSGSVQVYSQSFLQDNWLEKQLKVHQELW